MGGGQLPGASGVVLTRGAGRPPCDYFGFFKHGDMRRTLMCYAAGCRTADTAGRSRLLRPSVEGCETGAVSRSSLARERWRE